MGRSPGFASIRLRLKRPIQTRFPFGSCAKRLTLPQTITRRFIMQKARGHPLSDRSPIIGLPQLVGTWFQVLLTPLKGVLFTVQSPYLYTIGRRVVLSLGGWAPRLHAEFHELRRYSGTPLKGLAVAFEYRAVTFYGRPFQTVLLTLAFVTPRGPATPGPKPPGLGYPLSLAATHGVSVDFLSSRYLDVSVPWVRLQMAYAFNHG
jgi:hypothetical protein